LFRIDLNKYKVATIPVLLADSQFLTRKGISTLIRDMEGYETVAQIEDLDDLSKTIKHYQPKLVILDTSYQRAFLKTTLSSINQYEALNILAITNDVDNDLIDMLMQLNVKGILTKDCDKEEFMHAIITVAQGDRFYCSKILDIVFEPESKSDAPCHNLSKRELEVLSLVVKGYSTTDIANKLYLSVHTISSHRKNILKKLNLRSPVELIRYALENNMVN
jgi:DNA-binding NarL/FixJ family response regulator